MEVTVSFGLFFAFLLVLRLSASSAKNHNQVNQIKQVIDEKKIVIARPLKDHRKNIFLKMWGRLVTFFLWLIWRKRWVCKFFYSDGNTKGYLSEWPSSKDRVRAKVVGYDKCLGMYKLQEID